MALFGVCVSVSGGGGMVRVGGGRCRLVWLDRFDASPLATTYVNHVKWCSSGVRGQVELKRCSVGWWSMWYTHWCPHLPDHQLTHSTGSTSSHFFSRPGSAIFITVFLPVLPVLKSLVFLAIFLSFFFLFIHPAAQFSLTTFCVNTTALPSIWLRSPSLPFSYFFLFRALMARPQTPAPTTRPPTSTSTTWIFSADSEYCLFNRKTT